MRIKNQLTMILLFSLYAILVCAPISAQPPGECTNDVAASALDDECGFLNEKIFDLDTDPFRTGIDIELDGTGVYPDRNAFLRIGLDSIEVGNRTWWDGSSDFTWTFDGSGGTDPSFEFKPNQTTHHGKYEVIATTPTDESNFAGQFKLYQTGFVREDSFPSGIESIFIYDAGQEESVEITKTFHIANGSNYVWTTDNIDNDFDVDKCYRIQPDDESGNWYTVASFAFNQGIYDVIYLMSNYIGQGSPPVDFTGSILKQEIACDATAFRSLVSTAESNPGYAKDAYGIYLPEFNDPDNTLTRKWGFYQAGENYCNFMGGRLAIGADVDGYYPTNTVIYLDKHYSDSLDTYYGGYITVTQTSSLNFTGPEAGRYPAALECKYTYDSTEETIWNNQDIRAKALDGRFMIVNEGRINYAAGVTGGVHVIPEYEVLQGDYPGVDSAVGLRGGITLADVPIGGNDGEANINNAACLTTHVDINGGRVNRLAAVCVHTMGISKGHIEELSGVGIQPLIFGPTEATFGDVYGIRQEGNERNLYNGYNETNTKIYESVGSRYNYDAGSSIYWSDEPMQIEKLVGYNYNTPDFNPTNGASCEITNAYGVFLNPVKNSWTGNFITNGWGFYQEGNDPNYAKGTWEVDTNIDTTFSGDVSSYEATSAVSSAADIISFTGFKYITPDLPNEPNIDKMYGIYLQQICPLVSGSESIEKHGIYQAGSEPNYLKGPVTIDRTEKVRAFLSTAPPQQFNPNWYKLCLDGETYDNLGSFDSETYPNPTYQFKAKMDGYYQVNATVLFSVTLNPAKIGIAVRKNGTVEYALSYGRVFVNNDISLSISDIIPLNKDETIQLWVWIAGPNVQVSPSESGTYLSIHKIS